MREVQPGHLVILSPALCARRRSARDQHYRSERSYYSFGPFPNYPRADEFFRANEDSFEISDADTIAESFGVDYRVKETVTAGYLMGQLQVGSASFIAGVRVERTDTDFDAFDIVFVDGDAPNPPPAVQGEKNYTNVLPDLLMTWAIREDLLLRVPSGHGGDERQRDPTDERSAGHARLRKSLCVVSLRAGLRVCQDGSRAAPSQVSSQAPGTARRSAGR